jgi:plasmid stabilization system protein ParE
LIGIWNFISKDNPAAASSFCYDLAQYALSLRDFPERYGELKFRKQIRKVPYWNYLIFYKIDEQERTVDILLFYHIARDQNRLRLNEQPAEYAVSSQRAA